MISIIKTFILNQNQIIMRRSSIFIEPTFNALKKMKQPSKGFCHLNWMTLGLVDWGNTKSYENAKSLIDYSLVALFVLFYNDS